MHGTFNHTGVPKGRPTPEDIMFALANELYPGQSVSYQGRVYQLLFIQKGLAFLAGLLAPVPEGKLVAVG
jgi:hypothetical protein